MTTGAPLYRSLMAELVEVIQRGGPDMQKLPTELELCQMYGVSRITVRRALSELASQGLIYTVQGKGTFVTSAQSNAIPIDRIYRQFASHHGSHESISMAVEAVPEQLTTLLDVDADAPVFNVSRRKMTGGVPAVFERAYVLVSKLPPNWRRSDFERDELFLDTFTRLGLRPTASRLLLNAALADDQEMAFLEVTELTPILRIKRLGLGQAREPLWAVINTMRTDMGEYEMEVDVPSLQSGTK